ncbi:hypothetical protein ES703_92225 [subsurface metagenome]
MEEAECYIFTAQETLAVGEKVRVPIKFPSGNRQFIIEYAIFNADTGDVGVRFNSIKHISENEIILYTSTLTPRDLRFNPNLICFSDGSPQITLRNLAATEEIVDFTLVGRVIIVK